MNTRVFVIAYECMKSLQGGMHHQLEALNLEREIKWLDTQRRVFLSVSFCSL